MRFRWLAAVIVLVGAVVSARAVMAQATAPATADIAYPSSLDGRPGVGPMNDSAKFIALWNQRRGRWQQEAAADQQALVFLGDSITQGWGKRLGGAFGKVKVANRGISGDTTRGVLIRLGDVLELDPSGVVLLIGTNDLARRATPAMVAANVEQILAQLQAHDPELPIVLCAIMPSSATKGRPKEKIIATNKLLAAAVKDDPQVTFVDTYALFADDQGDAPAAEFPDRLHPNKQGYQKWAAALRPVLEQRGFAAVNTQTGAASR